MLTREQITKFAACAARLDKVDPWGPTMLQFRTMRLVDHSDALGCRLTPAGHDLLATVPHLPPEPAPVAPPTCKRCGGDTEVPVFMGPLMMPCPACANDDGSPKDSGDIASADDAVARVSSWYGETLTSGLVRVPGVIAGVSGVRVGDHVLVDTLRGDPQHVVTDIVDVARDGAHIRVRWIDKPTAGCWILIDSEDVARSFVGDRVEVDAPAAGRAASHGLHGQTVVVDSADWAYVTAAGISCCWFDRKNVRLRRVAP